MLEPFGLALDASFAIAVLAVCVGGFLRGFVGFGAAMIVVPTLSLLYGPAVAIPAGVLLSLPASLQLLPTAIRESEPAIVLPVAVSVFAAAPAGVALLVLLDPQLVKIFISALVVLMVVFLARGWQLPPNPGWPLLCGAGLAGGAIQGVAGVGGPPVVAVALARGGGPRQQRANVVGVMTAVALSAFGPLWWFDVFSARSVVLGALLIPVNALATWIGMRFFAGKGRALFRTAALVVLGLVGLSTLTIAVMDYLR